MLVISSLSFTFAQNKLEKADKNYENYAYIDAIKIYERVAEKGYKSKELFQKLGNSYYFNGILDKAETWYEKLFDLNQEVEPEYYYRYAQTLQSVKKYVRAENYMQKFYNLTNDYRGKLYIDSKEYLNDIPSDYYKYEVEDSGINSSESDYGVAYFNDRLFFSSTRKTHKIENGKDKWTNQNYSNLFSIRVDERGNPVYIDELKDELKSKYHEATPVFSNDGKTVYFTRNNMEKGKGKRDKNKTVLLKIYKAELESDGKWKNAKILSFNQEEYNYAHPALSKDEKTLYFVSDMSDTFGESDIYKVDIHEDGSFGMPKNLGNNINTKGRETFPYISKDSTLYFATDGRPGFGGLDIFKTRMKKDGTFHIPENISKPLNSEMDDFAFVEGAVDSTGFISSNRLGGKGFDDIYKFKALKKAETKFFEGLIVDSETQDTIVPEKVSLYDANQRFVKDIPVDENGNFQVELQKDREYYIKTEHPDYLTAETRVKGNDPNSKLTNKMDKKNKTVGLGDDLAKTFGINIYFSFDKYDIRPDAEADLAKIVEVMKQNPSVKIEVRSHTDSRQSESYNMRLSEYRAKNTRLYMINKGIHPSRIKAKGFGETQLLNNCTDDVECTTQEHQVNRRSEFVIIN